MGAYLENQGGYEPVETQDESQAPPVNQEQANNAVYAAPTALNEATPLHYPQVYTAPPVVMDGANNNFHAHLVNRRVNFALSKYFSEGMKFYSNNVGMFLLGGLTYCLIYFVAVVIPQIFLDMVNTATARDEDLFFIRILVFFAQQTISFCAAVFLIYPALSSVYTVIFNGMRQTNQSIKYKDFFSSFGGDYYGKAILLGLILYVITLLLSFPLFIPAIYFSMATVFTLPMHKEQKDQISISNSILYSMSVVNKYFCWMLLMGLLLVGLNIIGAILLGIGLLFTYPLMFCILAVTYHHLVGINGVEPWPLDVSPQVARV